MQTFFFSTVSFCKKSLSLQLLSFVPWFRIISFRYGDRIVAIKVLNRGSTIEERAALESRFAREVNMMSRVKHENLVKVNVSNKTCLQFTRILFTGKGICIFISGSFLPIKKYLFHFLQVFSFYAYVTNCFSCFST